MNTQDVIAKIEKIESLPTIPPILKKILSVIEDPRVSLQKITDFVSSDPTLTARVLKMVNSPVYGFPGRISSVSHAMVILGLNAVKGLLLGVSVFEIMQKNMIGLWEHSLSTAIFARIIAMKRQLQAPEEISIGALLHDIGKVIFIMAFKDEYMKIINSAQEKASFLYEIERQYFGLTHAEVGGIIAKKWKFPQKLIEPIMYHHRPQLAEKFQVETAIVHISNILALARGVGYSGEIFVPSVHPFAWEILNFKSDEILEIFKEAEEPITTSGEIFLSDE
ncbi:HDOD domain-containing protein [Thermodesulfovibrio sp. 3462-1]|jgi:putative nucleotidyltransferase with HDIG domain|uniref:HDOD domain-containing protein n=1 Tax=Thermodesulfovibrio obliviosus TaxID=3118332 RepID=A0AAU8H2H4_9BACT